MKPHIVNRILIYADIYKLYIRTTETRPEVDI